MSSFHMTSSYTYPISTTQFNFSSVQQSCARLGITLVKFSDAQLQSSYAMQGFKAAGKKSNEVCYVFLSLLQEGGVNVSSYYNGTVIFAKNNIPQSQIPEFIKSSIEVVRQNFKGGKNIQEQFAELQKLFQNLNKTSQKILKSSTNEMMAIQQIKSSQQYMAICNYAKRLTEQVQNLCKEAQKRQNQSKIKNQNIISKMLQIQEQKKMVQLSMFKYSENLKKIGNIDQFLNKFIQQKKKVIENKDFNDEESFIQYLSDSFEVKKLENQKKYLSKA